MIDQNKGLKDKFLTSQQVVGKFGITYQTLCYYTDIGLITTAEKRGHKRYYDSAHVASRLTRIKDMQSRDYSLKSIRGEILKEEG